MKIQIFYPDDDEDKKKFLWHGYWRKAFSLISSREHCQRSSNLWHAANRIWTRAESEFRINNASKSEELIAEEILELALKLKSEWHECICFKCYRAERQTDCKIAKGERTPERTMQEI